MPKENQPAAKFRLGYVTATVWKNGDFYSTVLSRSYKDGEDWKDTDQLSSGDELSLNFGDGLAGQAAAVMG